MHKMKNFSYKSVNDLIAGRRVSAGKSQDRKKLPASLREASVNIQTGFRLFVPAVDIHLRDIGSISAALRADPLDIAGIAGLGG